MSTQQPKLVAVQSPYPRDPRRDVPPVLAKAARAVEGGGIAVLPEYFYRRPDGPPTPEALAGCGWVEQALLEASERTDGALVATLPAPGPAGFSNTAVVAEHGEIVHRQPKVRPTPKEREVGIVPGDRLSVAPVQGLSLGVMVCADILALDLLMEMAALGPDVVAVPVLSPDRGDASTDPSRQARTSLFVARAWDLTAYVLKAGGFHEPGAVGRSLITAPWGVLAQAGDDFEETLLSARFDGEKLGLVRGTFAELGVET